MNRYVCHGGRHEPRKHGALKMRTSEAQSQAVIEAAQEFFETDGMTSGKIRNTIQTDQLKAKSKAIHSWHVDNQAKCRLAIDQRVNACEAKVKELQEAVKQSKGAKPEDKRQEVQIRLTLATDEANLKAAKVALQEANEYKKLSDIAYEYQDKATQAQAIAEDKRTEAEIVMDKGFGKIEQAWSGANDAIEAARKEYQDAKQKLDVADALLAAEKV